MIRQLAVLFLGFLVAQAAAAQTRIPAQNIYLLSPHSDDSVLTFGGIMDANAGVRKRFHYTIFANISRYRVTAGDNSVEYVTGMRYLEDIAALDYLLRPGEDEARPYSYTSAGEKDADLIGMPGSADFGDFNPRAIDAYNDAYRQVLELMKSASALPGSCAFFVNAALPNPNTGGKGHFNHFLLREAALKALHDLGPGGTKCDFYLGEDLPYYSNNQAGSDEMISNLSNRLGLQPEDYPIDVEAKVQAVEKYPSQLTPDYVLSVRSRAAQLGGKERVYRIPHSHYGDFHVDPSCSASYCDY